MAAWNATGCVMSQGRGVSTPGPHTYAVAFTRLCQILKHSQVTLQSVSELCTDVYGSTTSSSTDTVCRPTLRAAATSSSSYRHTAVDTISDGEIASIDQSMMKVIVYDNALTRLTHRENWENLYQRCDKTSNWFPWETWLNCTTPMCRMRKYQRWTDSLLVV